MLTGDVIVCVFFLKSEIAQPITLTLYRLLIFQKMSKHQFDIFVKQGR